jgi:pilus assembly protein CpaB
MRGRTVVLFLIAVLLAGGTAFLVRSSLNQRPVVATAQAPPPQPQKAVLVAAAAIARGQILRSGDFAWRPWPDNALAPEYIVSGATPQTSFAGWVVREPFTAGEPIVKAKIVAPGDHGFLAAVLDPGMRAVSITVDQTSDVSGFILPGDRVDVLVNLSLQAEGASGNAYQHRAAQTVLRGVRVIAVDQRADSKDGQPVVARTVTLEVTPKQSEVVALAGDMGKLALSLRALAAALPEKPIALAVADVRAPASNPHADAIDDLGSTSFTIGSEVSPLLPKPLFNHNQNDSSVTILRGNGK